MMPWPTEPLEQELSTVCADELFGQIVEFSRKQGFTSCSYQLQTPVPVFCPKVIIFGGDPCKETALNSSSSALASESSRYSRPKPVETRPSGRRSSHPAESKAMWVQRETVHDRYGAIGRITLTRANPEPTAQLYAGAMAAWILRVLHERMVKILLPKLLPEVHVTMTSREKEILRWTAEGKTASEIAQILGLSERTVNFHVNNVVRKFGAANKIQAVVKAMALGMLV